MVQITYSDPGWLRNKQLLEFECFIKKSLVDKPTNEVLQKVP